jgi:hypothetical protein
MLLAAEALAFCYEVDERRRTAEMLHPKISVNAILQAFRFVALDDNAHRTPSIRITAIAERGHLLEVHRSGSP